MNLNSYYKTATAALPCAVCPKARRSDQLVSVLSELGGTATLGEIYSTYLDRFSAEKPDTIRAAIRNTLQRNCATSKQWQKRRSLFVSLPGNQWGVLS